MPWWRVLLLEAGGPPPPESYVPGLAPLASVQGNNNWNYVTAPQHNHLGNFVQQVGEADGIARERKEGRKEREGMRAREKRKGRKEKSERFEFWSYKSSHNFVIILRKVKKGTKEG